MAWARWHHGSWACHRCNPCELDACVLHDEHWCGRWGILALHDIRDDVLCRDAMDVALYGVEWVDDIASIERGADISWHRSASCDKVLERSDKLPSCLEIDLATKSNYIFDQKSHNWSMLCFNICQELISISADGNVVIPYFAHVLRG